MSEEVKLCKDCKHFRRDPTFRTMAIVCSIVPLFWPVAFLAARKANEFAECAISGDATGRLVTGRASVSDLYFCSTMRAHRCGPEGKYWEPRA